MKLSLTMFFTVLSFLSSTMAFASLAHDGYIVKTKASHQFNKSVFNDIQKIGSEMGHFYVVKGERQAIEDLKLNSNVLYIEPNMEVYEGMVIGSTTKGEDMTVNPTKGKQLTNMRAAGSGVPVPQPPAVC